MRLSFEATLDDLKAMYHDREPGTPTEHLDVTVDGHALLTNDNLDSMLAPMALWGTTSGEPTRG